MNDTDQLLRIVSNKQQHNAQQNGEYDDLERVTSGQRFKNIRRDPGDQIFQKIIRNCLPGLRTQKIRHSPSGLADQRNSHAHSGGDSAADKIIDNNADSYRTQLTHISHFANTTDQCKQYQGRNQHFKQSEENVPEKCDIRDSLREQQTISRSQHNGYNDLFPQGNRV